MGRLIFVFGANGQDGLLTTAYSLERGFRVVAFSRTMTPLLLRLQEKSPNLTVVAEPEYLHLSNLSRYFRALSPDHVFYLVSQHGPSGTMVPNEESVFQSAFLNIDTPTLILDLASQFEFGCTFPLSSRIFSGYLHNAASHVVVSADTPPNPSDFYGEHKARLMDLVRLAIADGQKHSLPICFNHDSIFKRSGYVSWALAKKIASKMMRSSQADFKNPHASLDLSDAHDFCKYFVDNFESSSQIMMMTSGTAVSLTELTTVVEQRVLQLSRREPVFDLTAEKPSETHQSAKCNPAPEPILVGDGTHEKSWVSSRLNTIDSLALMTLVGWPNLARNSDIPARLLERLPEHFRRYSLTEMQELISIDFS